jgi:hypothetical protein
VWRPLADARGRQLAIARVRARRVVRAAAPPRPRGGQAEGRALPALFRGAATAALSRGDDDMTSKTRDDANARADRMRQRAADHGKPTTRDAHLADEWFQYLRDGTFTKHDLARLLTSVRFDSAYVRSLEERLRDATVGVRAASAARSNGKRGK